VRPRFIFYVRQRRECCCRACVSHVLLLVASRVPGLCVPCLYMGCVASVGFVRPMFVYWVALRVLGLCVPCLYIGCAASAAGLVRPMFVYGSRRECRAAPWCSRDMFIAGRMLHGASIHFGAFALEPIDCQSSSGCSVEHPYTLGAAALKPVDSQSSGGCSMEHPYILVHSPSNLLIVNR